MLTNWQVLLDTLFSLRRIAKCDCGYCHYSSIHYHHLHYYPLQQPLWHVHILDYHHKQ